MKKTLMTAAILMLGLSLALVSCQKLQDAFNENVDKVQDITDQTTEGAKDIIQEGKDEVKKGADTLTK